MTNIFNASMYEELPENLKSDAQISALAKVLDVELAALSRAVEEVLHLPRLAVLPDEVLDLLAWQYHVDFYSKSFSRETKCEMISESILWHRVKGTPYAVKKILKPFLGNVTVQENWEYGGEPYFFRLTVSGLRDLGDEGEMLLSLIDEAKNVRSWLEAITFDLTFSANEVYNVATEEGIGGKVFVDIAEQTEYFAELFSAAMEIETGEIVTDCCFDYPRNEVTWYDAIFEGESGKVSIDSAYTPGDIDYSFADIIRRRWEEFKKNPVIEYYGDGEFDEPEYYPITGDFLRLYFDCADGNIRYLTFYNPKEDLSGGEIKSFGSQTAQSRALLNSHGAFVTGIKRALLITKTKEQVI